MKHSQRLQKLTYSYTQIFWVSCDQPMPGPFPFPNLRKGHRIEVALVNRNYNNQFLKFILKFIFVLVTSPQPAQSINAAMSTTPTGKWDDFAT